MQFMAEMFMNCSNLVVEGNEKMKYTDGKNIMVCVQSADGAAIGAALETVSKAAELAKAAGEEVLAVVFGKDTDTKPVIAAGAAKVLTAGSNELQAAEKAEILTKLVEKYQPKALYMAGTPEGKMIAPAVAAAFESGCATDVTAEDVRTKVVETVKEIAESVNLEEAQVIVSGGRGMGSKDNFALVEQLAEVLGGVVGATRPAIEEGWVSRAHQVGQSGKIVAPKLYIACGISGATQHVSGMIGSGYIVAINKDEDASIFDVADVGIVGDVTKVLPVMIEEMKKRKAE